MAIFDIIDNLDQISTLSSRQHFLKKNSIQSKIIVLNYMQSMFQVDERSNDSNISVLHITKWLSQRHEFFDSKYHIKFDKQTGNQNHKKNYINGKNISDFYYYKSNLRLVFIRSLKNEQGIERWYVDELGNVFLKTKIHLEGENYITDLWSIIVDGVEKTFKSEQDIIHFFLDNTLADGDTVIINGLNNSVNLIHYFGKNTRKILRIDSKEISDVNSSNVINHNFESLVRNQFLVNQIVVDGLNEYEIITKKGLDKQLVSIIPPYDDNEVNSSKQTIIFQSKWDTLFKNLSNKLLTSITINISNFKYKQYNSDVIVLNHFLNRMQILKGAGQNKDIVDILNFLAGQDYILFDGTLNKSFFIQREKYKTNKLAQYENVFYHLDAPDINKKTTNNANKLVVFFLSLPSYDALISNDPIDRAYTKMFMDLQRSLVKDTYVLRIADFNLVRGSFYVNSVNFKDYEERIQKLIIKVKTDNDILDENIVTYGVSRGAVGALIHGAKLNAKVLAIDPIINDQEYVDNSADVHYVGENRPIDLTTKFLTYLETSSAKGVIISNKYIEKNYPYLKRIKLPKNFQLISLNDNTVRNHADFSRNSVPEQLMWLNLMLTGMPLNTTEENTLASEKESDYKKILYYSKESYRLEALKMYDELQRLVWNKMLDMEVTMHRIKDEKLSIARYGDGENKLIANPYFSIGFQKNNVLLAKKLKNVLLHPSEKLLIG